MVVKKGYKQTEIGIIPEDWDVKIFDDYADKSVKWSITGGPFGSNLKTSDYTDNGIQIIQLQNIGDGKFINESIIYTSEQKANELLSCNIYSDDIILSKMGDPVARACIIPGNNVRYVMASDGIKLVVDEKKFNKRFAFHYINSPFFRKRAIDVSTGSTRQRIGLPKLKSLNIIVPPLPEQTVIATVLSDIDEYILSLERLIAKKQAIKQGAMQNLLTGKMRLKGFEGEWKSYEIGKIGKFYSGLTGKRAEDFGKGKAKYITFLNVLTNVVIKTDILEYVNVGRSEQQNAVQKGDLFFNTSSETPEEVGMCAVLQADLQDTYLNSFCFGYRLINNEINPLFVSYLFNSEVGRKIMFNLAQGATRYNLSKSYFEKSVINIPKLTEQIAIATILSDMDAEIEALQAKLNKAKQVKQGAMQQLLTGKIRLINALSQSQKLPEKRIIPITAHIVGGHIVNKLYGSKGWGRTKLQKSMHLVDYYCQLDFGYEYIRNIAGPDSQALMNHIDSKFKQYGHVRIEIKKGNRESKHYNYIPTSKIVEIEQAYDSYPVEIQEKINSLLNKIKKMDLARAEIVSTLYAVWNNRIIKGQPINEDLLLEDFYDWSEHKSDFSRDFVLRGLNYMRQENIIPIGWGKYIDKKQNI